MCVYLFYVYVQMCVYMCVSICVCLRYVYKCVSRYVCLSVLGIYANKYVCALICMSVLVLFDLIVQWHVNFCGLPKVILGEEP